ncbi:hypothetical protein D3C81_2147480 [compost metagenome]
MAKVLPMKRPVPMAPPIAIMLIWAPVSCCRSPFSRPAIAWKPLDSFISSLGVL